MWSVLGFDNYYYYCGFLLLHYEKWHLVEKSDEFSVQTWLPMSYNKSMGLTLFKKKMDSTISYIYIGKPCLLLLLHFHVMALVSLPLSFCFITLLSFSATLPSLLFFTHVPVQHVISLIHVIFALLSVALTLPSVTLHRSHAANMCC